MLEKIDLLTIVPEHSEPPEMEKLTKLMFEKLDTNNVITPIKIAVSHSWRLHAMWAYRQGTHTKYYTHIPRYNIMEESDFTHGSSAVSFWS